MGIAGIHFRGNHLQPYKMAGQLSPHHVALFQARFIKKKVVSCKPKAVSHQLPHTEYRGDFRCQGERGRQPFEML